MRKNNSNVNGLGSSGKTFLWIALVLLNVYLMSLVTRQALADYLFGKVVHKGFPGLIEKLFSFSNQYSAQEKITLLKQATQINPSNPRYYHELGKVYLTLGKDSDLKSDSERLTFYNLAIENFQKSITINPVNPITQLKLASVNFYVSNDLNELIEATIKVEKIDPYNKVLTKPF